MKIVVTGGAGFIGANLCARLVATPGIDEVVALDNLSTGSKENLVSAPGAELVVGDILDAATLDEVFPGAASVVHLAARPSVPRSIADPYPTHAANTDGTFEVLEAARRHSVPHLVVASSSSVYGANPAMPKHEDLAPAPLSPYAASKLAAETYALAWARSFGIGVLAFRFFNVFGPLQPANHDYAAVVPAFVSAALDDRPLPVFGDGTQTRDFTFVDDVTAIITTAAVTQVTSPGPVNLAFGTRTSLLDLRVVLEDVLGRALAVEHRPERPGDVKHTQADQSRLRALFPDRQPVSLRDGVAATVEWSRRG